MLLLVLFAVSLKCFSCHFITCHHFNVFFFVILRGHYHQDFKSVLLLPLSPPHLFVNLMEIFDKYTVYYFFYCCLLLLWFFHVSTQWSGCENFNIVIVHDRLTVNFMSYWKKTILTHSTCLCVLCYHAFDKSTGSNGNEHD